MLKDKATVIQTLSRYFNLNDTLNRIVFINALIQEKYYEEAEKYLEASEELSSNVQLVFLNAKIKFYLGKYEKAVELFKLYEQMSLQKDGEHYLFLMKLINPQLLVNGEFSESYEIIRRYLIEKKYEVDDKTKREAVFNKGLLLIKEAELINQSELIYQLIELLDHIPELDYHIFLANLYHQDDEDKQAKDQLINFIKKTGDCPKIVTKLLLLLN